MQQNDTQDYLKHELRTFFLFIFFSYLCVHMLAC